MITLNQLNKKQDDQIRKLDATGLKIYIDNIAKSYYLNIIRNDKLSANNSIETLNKVRMIHSDKNIDAYISYALVSVFNDLFVSESLAKKKLVSQSVTQSMTTTRPDRS